MDWIVLFIYMIICYGIANTIIYANGPFHCFVKMHEIAKKYIHNWMKCYHVLYAVVGG